MFEKCSECEGIGEIKQRLEYSYQEETIPCYSCKGKKETLTNISRLSIGALLILAFFLLFIGLKPLFQALKFEKAPVQPSYQVEEIFYSSADQNCPYFKYFQIPFNPTPQDLSPIFANKCDYYKFTYGLQKWQAEDQNSENSKHIFHIQEIIRLDDAGYDYYLVDKQIIVKIPKSAFQNLREAIFRIVSSELRSIRIFMSQNGVAVDYRLYVVKFYENSDQLNSYLGLDESVQAITIPCNYLGMPSTMLRSKSQSKESILRQTFKHEIAHAVMCSSYGIDFWTELPEWVKEGSAAFYADDQEGPQFISSDKEKVVFSRIPYVRICFKRAFASASSQIMQSLLSKNLASIHEVESKISCQAEMRECKSDCREKQRSIIDIPTNTDNIPIVAQIIQEADECAKKCSFELRD